MTHKKKKIPYLPWLISFESAARHGNFSRAAEEIGLTPSAVSQQINNLEQKLGTKLFRRGSRGVELTETGHAYLPSVQSGFQHLQFGTKNLFGENVSSIVTIKAGVTFTQQILMPNLAAFQERYPDILLRIFATVWPDSNRALPEIDIEIKYCTSDHGGLGPPNAHEVWAMMACPKLIAKRGRPNPETLLEWPLIQVMSTEHIWARWFTAAGIIDPEYEPNLVFDLGHLAVAAAKNGRGAVLATMRTAGPELASGQLVILDGPHVSDAKTHRIFTTPGSSTRPITKIVTNWLLELCSET